MLSTRGPNAYGSGSNKELGTSRAAFPRPHRRPGRRWEEAVLALIVDDSRTMRRILGDIMRECGFEIVEAEDGLDALEKLKTSGPFAIALVDWNMPRMTGIDFVRAVRKENVYAAMRMMMVTTEAEIDNVVQALESGANEYMMKPFTKEAILEKLEILGLLSR